jgi:SAM-dependent methyltransferase
MLSVLERTGRRLKRALSLDFVEYDGFRLPPRYMRYCGTEFRDDSVFLGSARDEAKRLIRDFDLSKATRLLEIGCGPARLPIGILAEVGEIRGYDGVDIDKASVRWGARHVSAKHPGFRFHHIDARHERYNPAGRPMSEGFRLSFEDSQFDIIYLHSVFANMKPDDVYVYCSEFARLLRPSGFVFLTAFIEEDVPDVTVNPDDYIIQSKGPLHFARYERNFFFGIVARAGLKVDLFAHGADLGGQSVVRLSRA